MKKTWLTLAWVIISATGFSAEPSKIYNGMEYDNVVTVEANIPDFTDETPFSAFSDWEPSIAADPLSGYIYQAVVRNHNAKQNEGKIMLRISSDFGQTWEPEQLVCGDICSDVLWQSDPHVAVGSDGTLFLAFLAGGYKITLLRSTDHGQTWMRTDVPKGNSITNGAGWQDYPWLVIAPDTKIVYVTFLGSNSAWAAASYDYGKSFSALVDVSRSDDPRSKHLFYANGGVAKGNSAFFAESVEYRDSSGQIDINCRLTKDSGKTWQRYPVAQGYPSTFSPVNSLTMDAAGDLYMVYATNADFNENKKLYLRKSKDGIIWESEILLNDQGDSNFPQIVAGAAVGDIRISWQDNRNGFERFNTYFISSVDGMKTWTKPVRLSNEGVYAGAPYKFDEGYVFPYGDYISHAIDKEGSNHVIWGEGIARSLPGGCWYSKNFPNGLGQVGQ